MFRRPHCVSAEMVAHHHETGREGARSRPRLHTHLCHLGGRGRGRASRHAIRPHSIRPLTRPAGVAKRRQTQVSKFRGRHERQLCKFWMEGGPWDKLVAGRSRRLHLGGGTEPACRTSGGVALEWLGWSASLPAGVRSASRQPRDTAQWCGVIRSATTGQDGCRIRR